MRNLLFYILLSINVLISEFVISGFITDKNSGEALIGANLYILNSSLGVTTDKNGFYSLTINQQGFVLKSDSVDLVVQYLGYERIVENISLLEKNIITRDFELSPASIDLKTTEIRGEKETRQTLTQYSSIKVTQSQLSALPSLAEADIFRTLQSLPGVLQSSEFSTGLIIRGGNTDQNLILLDGITVYNPSHLGGIFSNFIVEAIKEANLTKGGFNAEYGGRLSAVLDVISREGNRKMFLDEQWAAPFEQTWMSYIYQQTVEGNIKPAILLATPCYHERFDYYEGSERREN